MNLGNIRLNMELPWCSVDNKSAFNVGDGCSIPGLGRPSGGGNGNPLHHSCLEHPIDRGAWRATAHRIEKSWTRLRRLSMHTGWIWNTILTFCNTPWTITRVLNWNMYSWSKNMLAQETEWLPLNWKHI